MTDMKEFQETSRNYKRKISGNFMLADRTGIQKRLFGEKFCVTRKIDGILQCLFWRDGESVMAGSGGAIISDLPCLEDFADSMRRAGLKSATVAAELFFPIPGGRPRCHDVMRALADPEERKQLRLAPFDIMELDGNPWKSERYQETHAELCRIFDRDPIRPVECRSAENKAEVEDIFQEWVEEQGAEGLVVHSDAPIVWKIKPRHTIDAAVVGFTVDSDSKIRELLFAVRREDGAFQVFVPASNGLTDEQKTALLEELNADAAESDYIRTDPHNVSFQMVRPRLVFELSVNELISESSAGKIKYNALLDYDEQRGWHSRGMTPGSAALSPVIVRQRPDKQPDPVSIRVSQLSDLCPFAESAAGPSAELPASTILSRRVFKKVSAGKTLLQKFMIWKTNKEESGSFPAYVFHYTDYSPNRKEFLKRDLRVSSSEEQIRDIMDRFIVDNIKKGWMEV